MTSVSRRAFLAGSCAAALGGCVSRNGPSPGAQLAQGLPAPGTPLPGAPVPGPVAAAPAADLAPGVDPNYVSTYAAIPNDKFPVPAIDLKRIDPAFLRKVVAYNKGEPGTIIIDPNARYLYFIQEGGKAIRYGVGVGREGFGWSGVATINSKQEWPDWYPPKEMIDRQPELRKRLDQLQSGIGMHGGPGNPLGARAMYLWQNNKDTLFRIHGTVEPWTIGKRVSSGCIRLINQDAIDLYGRVPVGTKVTVLGGGSA